MLSREHGMGVGLLATLAMGWIALSQPGLSKLTAPQIEQWGMVLQGDDAQLPLRKLRAAAQQGDIHAMRTLGSVLIGNADYALATEGLHFAEDAAKRGDAKAQFLLAKAYFDGVATLTKLPDMGRARTWFEMAAAGKHAAAMYYLGLIYQFGYGVERDPLLANQWLEKAANMGNPDARIALGTNSIADDNPR